MQFTLLTLQIEVVTRPSVGVVEVILLGVGLNPLLVKLRFENML